MIFNSWIIILSYVFVLEGPEYRNIHENPVCLSTPIIVSSASVYLIPEKGLVYYHGSPFTGRVRTYFQDSTISMQVEYVNGKRHGFYRKWFESGTLSFESEYAKGKKHGKSKTWWKNGRRRSEGEFQNGVAHGIQRQWYKSGRQFKERNLTLGVEQGMQRSWRENGKLYNNYEAKNGRIFGLKRASLCFELDDENIKY